MSSEIQEPFRLNMQAGLLQSGSISFGRFESESLSWERRSVFPHNRYLEEVEKYSKPGSVTEKKAYFEAEFRRKALLKQRAAECQDGGESSTDRNSDLHDSEDYDNCNESPCSSDNFKFNNIDTEVQHHEKVDVDCFDESTNKSGYDEDTTSQHSESPNYEFHPVITEDEIGETYQIDNKNVAGSTEQSIELTLIDHVEPADESSEANDDSSLACQASEKDHESISSAPQKIFSPKLKPAAEKKPMRSTLKTQGNVDRSQKQVNMKSAAEKKPTRSTLKTEGNVDLSQKQVNMKPAAEKKPTRSTLKTQGNVDRSQKQVNMKPAAEKKLTISTLKTQGNVDRSQKQVNMKPAAEKKPTRSTLKTQGNVDWPQKPVNMKPKTSESKGLLVKKTEKKSPRPASPMIVSGVKSSKAEDLRSEKTVKVKAQFPLSEKCLPGAASTVNRSKRTVNPSKTQICQSATGFSFKTDQRAENRKEFYTKIAEKMQAKEVEINQVEAKKLEKREAEMKQLRKSLNFKAKPLPSFYSESAHGSNHHTVTPISKTENQPRPSSQSRATRHDKIPLKSSVPLNIRPGSSASLTNRIRFPESVGRNHVLEKKDKEKRKDTKSNKQKDSEPRGRDMMKHNVKGAHTWNGPKVGIVS